MQVLRVIKLQCDTVLYIPFSFLYCTCISAKKINVYYCCLQFFYTSYGSILSVFLSMITQNGLLHCAVRVIHTCLGHRAVFGTGQGTVMSWRRRLLAMRRIHLRAHGLRHAPHLGYLILHISALLANKRVQYTWRGFCSHAGML